MGDDLLPPGWFGEHIAVLGESTVSDEALSSGLPYHACCMTCMMGIGFPVFAYGKRCGCVVHYECAADADVPEMCARHQIGSKMAVYSEYSEMCVTGCGQPGRKCGATHMCSLCHSRIKAALIRAVKLLWCGTPPPKPQFFMEWKEGCSDAHHKHKPDVAGASGAPIQSLYRVMMRNGVLWPLFFGAENMVDGLDLDTETFKLHYRVHPTIHVMWNAVFWIIENDPTFYFDRQPARVWMTGMWVETGYLKLPAGVHSYPDTLYTLPSYTECTRSLSDTDVAAVRRLLNIHFRESEQILMIDSKRIRKRTRYNIYSAERLLEEVGTDERGDVELRDVYAEDKNADLFVAELVRAEKIVVLGNRLYPSGIIARIPGLADKFAAGMA